MRRILNGPLLLSALLALLGGAAVFLALGQPADAVEAETVSVLALARDVPVGTALTETDLQPVEVPAAVVPEGAVGELPGDGTRFAAYPLVRGELLLASKLRDAAPGSELAAVIPDGRVAISVAVSDVISTGGFIAPGDRVDVLGVVTKDAADRADVVLEDVPVLAVSDAVIGQAAPAAGEQAGGGNPRSLTTTVTLAVTVEEAQRIVQVDEVGTLRLALRARET